MKSRNPRQDLHKILTDVHSQMANQGRNNTEDCLTKPSAEILQHVIQLFVGVWDLNKQKASRTHQTKKTKKKSYPSQLTKHHHCILMCCLAKQSQLKEKCVKVLVSLARLAKCSKPNVQLDTRKDKTFTKAGQMAHNNNHIDL